MSGRIVMDVTEGATHYHATYVKPDGRKLKKEQQKLTNIYFTDGKGRVVYEICTKT